MRQRIPKHIIETFGGAQVFRHTKRVQMDAILEMIEQFRLGCAHIPGYSEDKIKAMNELKTWRAEMTTRKWGK